MSLTIMDIWQLLQVHDILNLPTLPNSINNTRDEEICDKEDENQKNITDRFSTEFCDIIFFGMSALYSMDMCGN